VTTDENPTARETAAADASEVWLAAREATNAELKADLDRLLLNMSLYSQSRAKDGWNFPEDSDSDSDMEHWLLMIGNELTQVVAELIAEARNLSSTFDAGAAT
jgi:hypothetical protein